MIDPPDNVVPFPSPPEANDSLTLYLEDVLLVCFENDTLTAVDDRLLISHAIAMMEDVLDKLRTIGCENSVNDN